MSRAIVIALCITLLLVACSSVPPAPAWQGNAHGALEQAVEAYLTGNKRVAEAEMARARSEIARTGQPALLARAELVWCAAHVASLDFDGCPAWQALAADAAPAERAYAAYLYGSVPGPDISLLPEQHRAVAAGNATQAAGLADPLARLVAAGVLLRRGLLDPSLATVASDTASAQGWRRPLLAWLGLQARQADAAGALDAASQIRRRISLVEGGGAPK